ncbi:MAG: dTMP kinase, partial [Planctomycetota bacterium]
RYVMSTVVYQGHAVEERTDKEIHELRHLVMASAAGVLPDLTLLLDVPPVDGLERKAADAANDGPALDRFELRGTGFQERVRNGYMTEAQHHDGVRVVPPGTVDSVTAAIESALEDILAI